MSGSSSIEWTDATWNPVTGCDEVSPGCAHCYAKTFAERWRGIPGHPYEQGFDMRLWPERLDAPLHWSKPRMVFVNSMSDLFHDFVPDDYIRQVFAVMAACPQHTFQVLTKRPERMRDVVAEMGRNAAISDHIAPNLFPMDWPLPNVWLGVSIENRRYVGRADVLRATSAAVRFISAEPLLGPLLWDHPEEGWSDDYDGPRLLLAGIDWLITGGESGPGARPVRAEWIRGLRDNCVFNGVPFFFKQWGGARPKSGGRELDGRTWDEFPSTDLVAA